MSKKNKYCPECGAQNEQENRHCFECGESFEEDIVKKVALATSHSRKRIGLFLITIALIIGGLFLAKTLREGERVEREEWRIEEDVESPVEVEEEATEEKETKEEAIEEVFTYWELPQEELANYTHTLRLGFSNTNKVEAEIKHASITQGHYRYFLTVKMDEAASSDFEKYYRVDEVEKIEYDLSSGDYPFLKEDIEEHLEAEGFIYDIDRVDTLVRYTIYEPDLERLSIGSLPDYPYEYIIQQIDYAAEINDSYEDYLLFMEEYQLFPAE